MRIIGGKDYYDSARAFGEDRETVFVRHNHAETDPVALDFLPKYGFDYRPLHARRYHYSRRDNKTEIFSLVVILAGVEYRGVRFVKKLDDAPYWKEDIVWTLEDFQKYMKTADIRMEPERWRYTPSDLLIEQDLPKYFGEKMKPVSLDVLRRLIDEKIVIAIRDAYQANRQGYTNRKDKRRWYVNTDGLKAIEFAKVLDPYSAYQELSMFVGGVLPKDGNPMVEITDEKVMLSKHGMDKWSFRKHKQDAK